MLISWWMIPLSFVITYAILVVIEAARGIGESNKQLARKVAEWNDGD